MKTLLFISQLFCFSIGFSQIMEDFSDGNFSVNPTWTGTNLDFVVNSNFELQSNLTTASTSYLSTGHGLTSLDDKEWRMRIKLTFAPSASNFGRIYLTANGTNPTLNPDGFYLQFGEALALDAVKLYKQVGGVATLICSGAAGQIASSFNFGVKVTRDAAGLWSLFTDSQGGANYIFESSATDGQNILGTDFSWQCVYTASNANKFYLDDIYVGNIVVDNAAPVLLSALPLNANSLDVLFNEPLNQLVAEDINNYDLQPFNSASAATLDVSNPNLVHLTTVSPMINGNNYTLFALNMEDLAGNDSISQSVNFTYIIPENPSPGDVIINEFFADPTPIVGLPELEFVEIYNRSNKYFNLYKWKIGDASADGSLAQGLLGPGEYRVLCASSSVISYPGSLSVTSFPSLNNTGDNIVLKDSNGIILDQLSYTDDWYQSDIKKAGGYTLERINPILPCSSSTNWIASIDPVGGTPGVQNSVFSIVPDTDAPEISQVLAEAPNVLKLYFNEPLDSHSLANSILSIQPNLTEIVRYIPSSEPTEMTVLFSQNFVYSSLYTFTLQNIEDCSGNSSSRDGSFILPDSPIPGDVVINEILFNPPNGGSDFVELYNASDKVFDVFDWQFANIAGDSIANYKTIPSHFLIRAGEYVVVSKDTANIQLNFSFSVKGRFVQSELPSYNNDSGTVILISNNVVLDRVSYSADWHFALLDSDDGKSLERINAKDASQSPDNWHTAAESVNFGTPGRENSQFVPVVETGEFSLTSKVFSPDNDGFEDVLQIRYKMNDNDIVATISIYDEFGRLIRKLKENEYLATEGVFTWDGVNDNGNKASIGQYIVYFEAFRPDGGAIFQDKKVCVLAGKI